MPLFPPTKFGFRQRNLLFTDLELSGLDPKRHEIIEVAALRVSQPSFKVENSYYTKVRPVHIETGDPKSLEVVSYQPAAWTTAIPLRQMLTELSEFAPDSLLVGWGVQTEWDFLISALEAENLPYFFTGVIEVSSIAFCKLYDQPELDRLGLAKVCRHLKIPLDNHKPDSDIRATYEIFKRLMHS